MTKQKTLTHIDPDLIIKNPENPRVIFREEELDALMRSIEQVGIQVPLSVYEKNNKYVLIDGERRWRCSRKLGLKNVPVIVEPQPTPLNNLLMMFNIHNVRVQWDLIALAFKVKKLRELVKKEQKIEISKKELADLTGVSSVTISRCDDLLSLPMKYQDLIWSELEKPKGEQKYTEDLFLEIKKSIKTIESYLPEIIDEYSPAKLLDTFFHKFESGVENNRVRFRDISKIARGELVGIQKGKILETIEKYISQHDYSIEKAFEDSVADAYSERSTEKKLQDVIIVLKATTTLDDDEELKEILVELREQINRLIK
jgi:ParB family transcriptional regulator, chromosome partitioning protein